MNIRNIFGTRSLCPISAGGADAPPLFAARRQFGRCIDQVRLLLALIMALLVSTTAEAQRPGGKKVTPTAVWGITEVTEPVRAGKKAQRFEIRAGDCKASQTCADDREWAMLRLSKTWRYGTPQWIGFSIYLPEDFASSARVNTTVAMIHQQGGPKNRKEGYVDLPVVQFNLRGNQLIADVHYLTGNRTDVADNSREMPLGSVGAMRGKWTDVLIHFGTSDSGQVLEVFLNGNRKIAIADLEALGIDASNVTVYDREAVVENFVAHRPQAYTFNYGLYRAFVSRHGGPMPTQVVLIDELRLGKSPDAAVVDEAKPVD